MNRKNLDKLRFYGATPGIITGVGARDQVNIDMGGRVHVFMGPPGWDDSDRFTRETEMLTDASERYFEERYVASLIAARGMMATAKFGNAFVTASSDKRLSDAGRRDTIKPAGEAVVSALSTQGAALLAERVRLAGIDAELFESSLDVPTNDVQTVMVDQEIRDHVLRSPSAESDMSRLLGLIAQPRICEALARSPVPLPDAMLPLVRERWREIVTERQPEQVAQLQGGMEYVDWADYALRTAARITVGFLAWTQFEAYRVARAAGGAYLFASSDGEARAFEERALSVASQAA